MHACTYLPTLISAAVLLLSFQLGRPINVFIFGQCCFISSPYLGLFPLAQHEMWLWYRKSYKTKLPINVPQRSTNHSRLCIKCWCSVSLYHIRFLPVRSTTFTSRIQLQPPVTHRFTITSNYTHPLN